MNHLKIKKETLLLAKIIKIRVFLINKLFFIAKFRRLFLVLAILASITFGQISDVSQIDEMSLLELDKWLKSNPQKSKEAVNHFLSVAGIFYSQNNFQASLSSYDKAEIAARFSKDDLLLADCLWGKGLVHKQNNPKLSNLYLIQAKNVYKSQSPNNVKKLIISLLLEIYNNYLKLNLTQEAESSLKEAYQTCLKYSDTKCLNVKDLIGIYFYNRSPVQAILWYKNSLKFNTENPEIFYLRVSTLFYYQGEYELAFEYLSKAEEQIYGNKSKNLWQIWQKYSEYYMLLGQYEDSIKYGKKQCNSNVETDEIEQALYCYSNLGHKFLTIKKYDSAENAFLQAEKISNNYNLNESSRLTLVANKMYLLAETGNISEAEKVIDQIYPNKDLLGWGGIKNLYWYRAFVYQKQSRYTEALNEIDTILVKLRELKEVDQIKRFLTLRGKILFEMGRKDEAYQTFQESVDLIETGRRQIFNVRTSLSYFNKYKEAYDYLLQLSLEKNDADKTVILADLLKSRILADKVLSANADSANKVQGYQSFYKTKEAEDLLQQIWILSEKSFAENIDNDAEIAALEKTFQERLEAYNLLVNKKYEFAQAELTGQDIKKLNNIDANIVSFSFLPNGKLVRFLFRKSKQVQITELNVNRADLKNKIKNFRQQILAFKPFYATAQELYQTLLPAEKELDFTKPLIIIPDEELWSVPFSALISPNQKYLIEKTDLALLPSLKSLLLLDNGKSAAQTKVALFANSTAQGQSVLNSVKSEAEEIAKIYPKSVVFSESKATKEAFKQSVAESSILHVASHGLINLENPFESALILSKTDKDDGKLTVNEIIDIKIPSSLVVLSACDTSNGQILGGEGLLSLSWAFLVGGAKEVVGTQWKIEDTQSKKMMIEFHKGLKKGGNPVFSLQQAQRKALKNIAPFNHPYYWSGFVSIGSFR